MKEFVLFSFLILLITLIVGFIKPSIILRWSKNPTKLKVLGWWFLLSFFTVIFGVIGELLLETDESRFNSALEQIENKNYSSAIGSLKRISNDSKYFRKVDSLIVIAKKGIKITEKNEQEKVKKEEKEERLKLLKKKYTKTSALFESRHFVEKRLKAPSTADFSYESEKSVQKINDTTFLVTGYVDSENSFGAKLRNNYSCKIVFLDKLARVSCDDLIIK
ncbi:hypothetical protein G1K37_11315 [Tenacibaculum dicentrarchi]|nr:hypothetical protein [Tenacibaculum dicentrarchi]